MLPSEYAVEAAQSFVNVVIVVRSVTFAEVPSFPFCLNASAAAIPVEFAVVPASLSAAYTITVFLKVGFTSRDVMSFADATLPDEPAPRNTGARGAVVSILTDFADVLAEFLAVSVALIYKSLTPSESNDTEPEYV